MLDMYIECTVKKLPSIVDGGICGDGVKIFFMLTPSIKSAFKCPNGTDKNTLYHKILKV